MNRVFRIKEEMFPYPHPLKEEFRKRKVPLWYLRNHTEVPEPKLSRYLSGIDPMPSEVEKILYELLSEQEGMFGPQVKFRKMAIEAMRKYEEKKEALRREKIEQESKEEPS